MKPLLSTDESSVDELHQSISFSDVFDPNSPSFIQLQADPVRASTPVSSEGDISGVAPTCDSSCSILAPQNISLVSQDLTDSLSMQTPSPTKDSSSDQHCLANATSLKLDCPQPLLEGYVYGLMCFAFKLVGDNIDKTIKPRDMCVESLPQFLHYFNVYAVLDRVDFRSLSADMSIIDITKVDTDIMLPSEADMEAMIANFSVLISRLLVHHLPALCEYSACVAAHIDHKYSSEMSAKSHVVSENLQCDNCYVIIVMGCTHNVTQ